MRNFIQKLEFRSDLTIIKNDLEWILSNKSEWLSQNQIGIRHRPGAEDQWKDATGWTYDPIKKERYSRESDFTKWNDECPEYTRMNLDELAKIENVTSWGRIRFMRLEPKRGLTMHVDDGVRYHFVLETNHSSIFGECFKNQEIRSIAYHVPADGHWYKVDTSREHFVYNGGYTPRIHLVAIPC